MIIREMTNEDILEVAALDEKAFKKAWNRGMFADEINKDYSYYFVATADGSILGYAGIWCLYETAELMRIAVLPDEQGKGIAKLLMERILSEAKAQTCERMMLEVRASNISAQGLYEKYGFNEISIRRGYYDGEDAIIMEAALG